jgi:L-malate glycosyltransferase
MPKTILPKTILFVHRGGPWIRGSELVLIDLIKGVQRGNRFSPILWCNQRVLASALSKGQIRIHHSPTKIPFHPNGRGWSVSAFWAQVRQTIRYIRLHDVALIHCSNVESMQWLVPAARYAGVPLLCHIHMLYTALDRSLYLVHRSDFVVGCSGATLQGLIDDGFPASRIETIYNGVRVHESDKDCGKYGREGLGIIGSGPVLAVIGALEHHKGVDVAIEAVRNLHLGGIAAHLLVIGVGGSEPDLRAMSNQIGGGHYVHFLGQRPRDEVLAILSGVVDVTVVPSRYEALSLVALESQAVGVPVVGSDIGGIPEAIAHGDTGLIFKAGDNKALAASVEFLLRSSAKRVAMGAAGKKRISEHFSVEHMVERFSDVYRRMVDADWVSTRAHTPLFISTRSLAKAGWRIWVGSRR